MFGLMTVKAHKRQSDERVARLESSIASKDDTIGRLCIERDRLNQQVRDLKAAAARDITAEQRRNERLAAEIAVLRPDAEWARARKAKAAEYEASKRVRKAKGAG